MSILFGGKPAVIRKGPVTETVSLPDKWSAYIKLSGDTFGQGDILTVGANSSGGQGIQLHVHNGDLRLLHSAVAELYNFGAIAAGDHEIALHWTPDSWEVDLDGSKTSAAHEIEPSSDNLFVGKANGFDPGFSIDFVILVEDAE